MPTIFDRRPAIIKGNVARIPLGLEAKHGYALVDKEFAYLDKYNWTVKRTGRCVYAVRRHNGHIEKMQWYILPQKEGFLIDHKDNNGLNNRVSNLRYATKQQNQFNLSLNSKNTSGYKGVSFRKDIKKWGVRVRFQGKYISLGAYQTALEAAKVYNTHIAKYRGEFARLNKV